MRAIPLQCGVRMESHCATTYKSMLKNYFTIGIYGVNMSPHSQSLNCSIIAIKYNVQTILSSISPNKTSCVTPFFLYLCIS